MNTVTITKGIKIIQKKYTRYKRLVRTILLVLGALFLLILARESWGEISGLTKQIQPIKLIVSICIGVFGNITAAIYFNKLLKKYGVNVSNLLAVKMYMIGQITKYIPGKIWSMTYQASYVTGIAGATGVVLANIEMMVCVMFITGVIAITLLFARESSPLCLVSIGSGMIGFVFVYHTNFVEKIVSYLSGRLKITVSIGKTIKSSTGLMEGTLIYIFLFISYVLSNMIMLSAVFSFSFQESSAYIALLSAAWILGVLTFIVPAGMGVREILFIVTSSYVLPEYNTEILASIAICSRLWQITQEFIGMFLGILIKIE